jgi:hypothetical protein
MRAARLAVAAVALVVGAGPAAGQAGGDPSAADDLDDEEVAPAGPEDELPAAKFGVFTGMRQNVGELGDSYGLGWIWGIDAHYQPTELDRAFSFGLAWSVAFTRVGADDPTIADDPLRLLELSLGVRMRRALGQLAPRFVVAGVGATMLRANVPIAPHDERSYVGGYGALGIEQYVLGRYLLGLEARYGLFGDGPAGLTVVFGVGFGS